MLHRAFKCGLVKVTNVFTLRSAAADVLCGDFCVSNSTSLQIPSCFEFSNIITRLGSFTTHEGLRNLCLLNIRERMATSGQQVLIKRILCVLSKIFDETEDPENTYTIRSAKARNDVAPPNLLKVVDQKN